MTRPLGEAPLFPLPDGSLLPGELLPLRIFEPRYRTMMKAVREGDRLIAVATLLPGWEIDYHGNPAIAKVVGMGRVVRDRLNDDGTSDIVLHGLTRATIAEELDSSPFRRASVELHTDTDNHPAEIYRLGRHLLQGLAERATGDIPVVYDVTCSLDVGKLTDRVAGALELSPPTRVAVMQAINESDRVDVLLGLLDDPSHAERMTSIIPSLSSFPIKLQGKDP
ncbi:MAG: Lon protease-like protein [Pseudohongiellaceae bacterium]|jgi:Lon protease-like protein